MMMMMYTSMARSTLVSSWHHHHHGTSNKHTPCPGTTTTTTVVVPSSSSTRRRSMSVVGYAVLCCCCVLLLNSVTPVNGISSAAVPPPMGDSTGLHMIRDTMDNDPAIERLIAKNREWVERTNREDPDFFPTLGQGQSPDYLYIGCSDARVAISDLIGIEMGELFVHRNIANMVVSSDLNLLSVLTYAVHFLKVKHILVTGHYDCGGVRAAVQKQGKGQVLDAWLQNIRDVYRLHKKELDAIEDDEERHRRLVELNISEQCLNLYKTSIVQSRRLQTYGDANEPFTTPRIHGLVFDPATGILKEVPIDYRRRIDELKDTYDLFDLDKYEASYVLQRANDAATKEAHANGGLQPDTH